MIEFIKGWKLRTKIIVGVIVFLVGFYIIFGGDYRERVKNGGTAQTTQTEETTEESTTEELSEHDAEQESYARMWGEPPEGYEWNDDKELVPISDSTLSPEDVLYGYARGCSMLDFATAGRYAKNSSVINQYETYYSSDTTYDERLNFVRKVYKRVLEVTTIDEIIDTATFADGSLVYTVRVNTIDLSNKEFWLADKESMFLDMRTQGYEKKDNLQARKFVYDKIVDYYNSDAVQMVQKDIEIKLSLVDGTYFVTDDTGLKALCTYEEGEQVVDFIFDNYSEWVEDYNEMLVKQAEEERQKQQKK